MILNRSLFLASLCGLALVGGGCGDDDNQTLSYDDTGTEIGEICDTVSFEGLTGKPAEDVPALEQVESDFEQAIQDVRDLEVDEELAETRDEFADVADQQLAVITEAKAVAEEGNAKKYGAAFGQLESLGKQSDELASQLGATACIDQGDE